MKTYCENALKRIGNAQSCRALSKTRLTKIKLKISFGRRTLRLKTCIRTLALGTLLEMYGLYLAILLPNFVSKPAS